MHSTSRRPWLTHAAALAVRLAAAYVLFGAGAKLFYGTPADLPEIVRSIMPWNLAGLFAMVVAIELFVSVTAVISPRIGWAPLVLVLVVFLGVLGVQVAEGESACGCLGGVVTVSPTVMLAIDAAALAVVLLTMPWKTAARLNWRPWSMGAAMAASVAALGYLYVETTPSGPSPTTAGLPPAVAGDDASAGDLGEDARRTTRNAGDSNTSGDGDDTSGDGDTSGGDDTTGGGGGGDASGGVIPDPTGRSRRSSSTSRDPDGVEGADSASRGSDWRPPADYPRFVVLQPDRWVGSDVARTVLHTYVDTSRFPGDCRVVFYMETCGHCARHIRSLKSDPPDAPLVFVQLPTVNPSQRVLVRQSDLPEGLHVELTSKTKWMMYVPWEVRIESRVVRDAAYLGD